MDLMYTIYAEWLHFLLKVTRSVGPVHYARVARAQFAIVARHIPRLCTFNTHAEAA